MKLEGHDNSLQKGGFNKGWAQNNWMPSAELLAQASAWVESIACTCFAIKYIQFF